MSMPVCVRAYVCVRVCVRACARECSGPCHNFPAVSCTLVDVFVTCACVCDSGETEALPRQMSRSVCVYRLL